ncbi:MAG: CBS domain-containing protein [Candidatus Micrarchaeota archaeon]|nr:CBS domain-containing protein [Candidatus Micrarchaeota archaeon]
MQAAFAPIPKELIAKTEYYDYKDPLSSALTDINKLGAVIVTKDGKYYGIADQRTISKMGMTKVEKGFAIGKIAKHTPRLSPESSIETAIFDFYSASAKALPYYDGEEVSGMVRRTDMLKVMLSLNLLASDKVRDAMSVPVIAIDHNATVDQAVNAMKQHKVNRLVVVEKGVLFGILSYRDLMRYGMVTKERIPKFTAMDRLTKDKVSDICQKNVFSIDADDDINAVIRSFIKNNISSLLVVKRGKPAGIVTIRDVLELSVRKARRMKSRIIISGIDDSTREYEQEVMGELDALAARIGKLKKVEVDYISLNIKGVKTRSYELSARLGLAGRGTISMHSTGFLLDNTLKELTDKLYNAVERKKEIIVTNRKEEEREYTSE